MKKFVIGDIHGNFKALKQCLKASKFNYDEDKLIVLGDTCDGFPDVKECFDELLKVKNLVYILGNHDEWAYEWYGQGKGDMAYMPKHIWTSQGGRATLKSYGLSMPEAHKDLLKNAKLYHVEYDYDDVYVFMHGGLNPNQKNMEKQDRDVLLWDRDLVQNARWKNNQRPDFRYAGFDRIYVGHTTTQYYGTTDPLKYCNVFMLDTGAGWSGKLTIMDIESGEFWQSYLARELYPEAEGRR